MSSTIYRGVVHGKTIELDQAPGLPDGEAVTVAIQRVRPPAPPREQPPSGGPDDYYHADSESRREFASQCSCGLVGCGCGRLLRMATQKKLLAERAEKDARIAELEKQLDPNRTSSGLTPEGEEAPGKDGGQP